MKKSIFIIFLFLSGLTSVGYSLDQGYYTIEDNLIYIDDSNAYVAAYPHTTSGGWVYVNVTSKRYGGLVDFAFGFDGSIAQPRRCDVYDPHDKIVFKDLDIPDVFFDNMTHAKYNYTASYVLPPKAYDGTLYLWDRPTTEDQWRLVEAYEFEIADLSTRSIEWSEIVHYEWRNIANENFDKHIFSYAGATTWYTSTFDIDQNVEYHLRILLDVKPRIGWGKTKYTVAIKPHSETISQAIGAGHFYMLDPWLDWGYDQRVKITIDNGDIDEVLTDFPLSLHLSNNTSGINNEDVSFIFDEIGANNLKMAVTTDDGETQCYVEIEYWDNGDEIGDLWVKVPTVSNTTDTVLYLYYDKDHADNAAFVGVKQSAPGEAVWSDNFAMVQHLDETGGDATTRFDSTDEDTDMTVQDLNTPDAVGQINGADGFERGDTDWESRGDDATLDLTTFTVEGWFWLESGGAIIEGIFEKRETGQGDSKSNWIIQYYDGDLYGFFGDGAATSSLLTTAVSIETWYHFALTYDATADDLILYLNGALVDSDLNEVQTPYVAGTHITLFGVKELGGHYLDGILDDPRVSTEARRASHLAATYETGIDHLVDWGTPESFVGTTTSETSTTTVTTDTSYTTTTVTSETSSSTTSTTTCTSTTDFTTTCTTECDTSTYSSTSSTTTCDTSTDLSTSSTTTCTTSTESTVFTTGCVTTTEVLTSTSTVITTCTTISAGSSICADTGGGGILPVITMILIALASGAILLYVGRKRR